MDNLSEKRKPRRSIVGKYGFETKDVKEKIQTVQRRLKSIGYIREEDYIKEVDKIFKEEFGEKLT